MGKQIWSKMNGHIMINLSDIVIVKWVTILVYMIIMHLVLHKKYQYVIQCNMGVWIDG